MSLSRPLLTFGLAIAMGIWTDSLAANQAAEPAVTLAVDQAVAPDTAVDIAPAVAAASDSSQPGDRGVDSDAWNSETWPEFDAGRILGRTMLATAGFAAVCLLLLAVAHRVKALRIAARGVLPTMELLDTLVVAPRCTLQLVRVDSQRFLVAKDGSGLRSVTPLSSFTDTLDDVAEPPAEASRASLTTSSVAGLSLEDAPSWQANSAGQRRSDRWQGLSSNP